MRAGVSGKGQRERTGHKEHPVITVPHTNLKCLIRDVIPSETIYAPKVASERVLGVPGRDGAMEVGAEAKSHVRSTSDIFMHLPSLDVPPWRGPKGHFIAPLSRNEERGADIHCFPFPDLASPLQPHSNHFHRRGLPDE